MIHTLKTNYYHWPSLLLTCLNYGTSHHCHGTAPAQSWASSAAPRATRRRWRCPNRRPCRDAAAPADDAWEKGWKQLTGERCGDWYTMVNYSAKKSRLFHQLDFFLVSPAGNKMNRPIRVQFNQLKIGDNHWQGPKMMDSQSRQLFLWMNSLVSGIFLHPLNDGFNDFT